MNGIRNSLGSYSVSVTNTIFTNGELDAFSGSGIWFTNDPDSIAYFIPRKLRKIICLEINIKQSIFRIFKIG